MGSCVHYSSVWVVVDEGTEVNKIKKTVEKSVIDKQRHWSK